jgi:hypothetical protein
LESVVTEIPGAKPVAEIDKDNAGWEEILARVQAYLSAWRLGDPEWSRDCAREIVRVARRETVAKGSEVQVAIEEADRFLNRWFEKVGSENIEQKLLFGAPANSRLDLGNREQMADILRHGAMNLARAKTPARLPETRPMTMQTSLSRLPSIRLIGGWIVLIALLFLAFVLTHR